MSHSTVDPSPPALRSALALALALLLLAACTRAGSSPEASASPATSVTVTYLANEGFLLEAGERKVLIDALFGDGLAGYPAVSRAVRDRLERGDGRFGEIDCVLATHEHSDHFEARAVARFLSVVPAQFLSTAAAVEEIEALGSVPAGPPPRRLRPGRHEIESLDCGGIPISAMSFHHGRLTVRNLAYIVEVGGLRVLHVGDTEITPEEIRPYRLREPGIDIALLPAWHLADAGRHPLVREIDPGAIVAMHLASPDAPESWFGPVGSLGAQIEQIRRHFPAAWIPTRSLETKTFPGVR